MLTKMSSINVFAELHAEEPSKSRTWFLSRLMLLFCGRQCGHLSFCVTRTWQYVTQYVTTSEHPSQHTHQQHQACIIISAVVMPALCMHVCLAGRYVAAMLMHVALGY
jgi:hypothetical protein